MGFKLNNMPYNEDDMNIGVYKRHLKDGSSGKSNHTGIILQTGLPKQLEDATIAHEKVHQLQQRNGELDYDDENFYWKGKVYPREKLNEHNENLPWEKDAYKESKKVLNGKQKDQMKQRFQLKGYRGNNKPFENLTEKGLMGPSMNGDPFKKSDKKRKKESKKYGCIDGVCAPGSSEAGKKLKSSSFTTSSNKPSKNLLVGSKETKTRTYETPGSKPDYDIQINRTTSGQPSETLYKGGTGDKGKADMMSALDKNLARPGKAKVRLAADIKSTEAQGSKAATSKSKTTSGQYTKYKKVKRGGQNKLKQTMAVSFDQDKSGKRSMVVGTKNRTRLIKEGDVGTKRYERVAKRVDKKLRKNIGGGAVKELSERRRKTII